MKAVLTLDNGSKVIADVINPDRKKLRFHADFERSVVKEINRAQLRAAHKVVKAHILRN